MTCVKAVKTMEEDQSMASVQLAARECLHRLEVGQPAQPQAHCRHARGIQHVHCHTNDAGWLRHLQLFIKAQAPELQAGVNNRAQAASKTAQVG